MFNFYIYDKMLSKNGLGSLMEKNIETNRSVDKKHGSVSGATSVMRNNSLVKSYD